MFWLEKLSPRLRSGGSGTFYQGVINPWRVISDHEYFIFERGGGHLVIDGGIYACPERSFLVIPPGRRHISYADTPEVLLHWGHFDWVPTDSLPPPVTFVEGSPPDPRHFRPAPSFVPAEILTGAIVDQKVFALLREVENMLRFQHDNPFGSLILAARTMEIFARLLLPRQSCQENRKPSAEVGAEEIRLVLTKLAHTPMNRLPPLEQILGSGPYSYSRQERLFKKEFGVTPHQYVTLLRVERIKFMLQNSGLGDEPRRVLDEISQLRSLDVLLPTRQGPTIRRRCITDPTEHQAILLHHLSLHLPRRLPMTNEMPPQDEIQCSVDPANNSPKKPQKTPKPALLFQ